MALRDGVMAHQNNPRIDGRLGQAVSHPVRIAFLRLLAHRKTLSPREALCEMPSALEGLPEPQQALVGEELALNQVSYHVQVLETFGVIETSGERNRDGGMTFRATDAGELLMLAIGASPEGGHA